MDSGQQRPTATEKPDASGSREQQFIQQVGQSLATKIAMILLRLIRNAILARVLGPTDRGLFSLVTSLPELIMTAGNAGLSNAASYHAAKRSHPLRSIVANTNTLMLVIGLVLVGMSFLLVEQPWLVKDYHGMIQQFDWIIALAIPLLLFKVVNVSLLNVLHRIGTVNLISLLESLLPLLLFLLLWWVFQLEPLMAAVYAWCASLLILSITTISQLKSGIPLRFEPTVQKNLLSFGSRGYLDTLFQKLLLRIDFLFVSALLGSEALGYYAMATAAAELLLTIPNALSIPLFSFFLRKSAKDKNEITPIVLRMLLTCMLLAALLFAVLGKLLIYILFGEAYLPAYPPLVCLLPGIVFLSYCSLIRLDLLGHNMPGTVSIISGMAVLTNVALNMILIPLYGINGAAIAASFAYGLAAVGLYRTHSRLTGLKVVNTVIIKRSDLALAMNILNKVR